MDQSGGMMRTGRLLLGLLAYYYAVIAVWGAVVLVVPPESVREAWGPAYTKVWATAAMVGGSVCFFALCWELVRRKQGKTSFVARSIEMVSAPAVVMAAVMYDALQWALVFDGFVSRSGLSVLLHLVAVPAAGRMTYLMATQIIAILQDSRARKAARRADR